MAAAITAECTALKQCTALDMGSFRQQCSRQPPLLFVVHCILGEDCQQTFSCLPPVVSLILTKNKPNIPDRQTCQAGSVGQSSLVELIPGTRHPGSHVLTFIHLFFSDAVDVAYSPMRGRYTLAARDIETGECLAIEKALVR